MDVLFWLAIILIALFRPALLLVLWRTLARIAGRKPTEFKR